MTKAKNAIPDGYRTLTPVLTFHDASAAIAWCAKAFGAEEVQRSLGPGGVIMHAEIRIGDSRLMLSDAVMGGKSPKDYGGSPASIWIYVEDGDALFRRAVAAGAEVVMPMSDMFWGDRFGSVRDPQGYHWSIATRKEDLTPDEIAQRQAEFFKQQAGQGPSAG